MGRVLAIHLDGYDDALADRLIAGGGMPNLARLRAESARFALDHGSALRTGLAGEHVATGMAPARAGRWSAIHFDRRSYRVWQEGARFAPFPAKMRAKTVVFDVPYFDLARAPEVRGLTGWGAHDPGVYPTASPGGLLDEVSARFGPYPATAWIYGFAWPSPEKCRAMGEALARGAERRGEIALWLLKERCPDWDLALIGVSEAHSVLEGLWHGLDPDHPLHRLPSAPAAGEGLRAVYGALDRLIGDLARAFPDAALAVFSLHGMGPNKSDAASMALLPELLYRHAFGRPFFRQLRTWSEAPGGLPVLAEDGQWEVETPETAAFADRARAVAARFAPPRLRERLTGRAWEANGEGRAARSLSLWWMPAARYQPLWPRMRAFALPSFYDGQVRINLRGRERRGRVRPADYRAACAEVEALLGECRDPATGEGVVEAVECRAVDDPLSLPASGADVYVTWKGAALAFDHPRLGRIGPIPYRRPGGHTGGFGMAYLRGAGLAPGDHGLRSAFDVVPTLWALLGEPAPPGIDGSSLLAGEEARAAAEPAPAGS